MAKRRRRSGIAEFFEGFNAGYSTVGRVLQDAEMRNISEAQPETDTGFTADQGAQLEAAASSGQYDVGYDQAKGAYTVTPKAGGDTGTVSPVSRMNFLGKTYDQPLSDSQKDSARLTAMSGVLSKFGQPDKALALRQQARQGELTDMQIRGAQRQEQRDQRADNQQAAQDAFMERWKGIFAEAKEDPVATFSKYLPQYNNATEGPFGDGSKIEIRGDQAFKIGKDGKELGSQPLTEQNVRFALMDAMHSEGALLNTGRFDDYLKHLQHVQERAQDIALKREGLDREDKRHKESVGIQAAGLALRQKESARADARLAKDEAAAKERQDSAVAIYKQNHPDATPAELSAVRTGVLQAIQESRPDQFATTTDQYGTNITRTNKSTGAVDIIDPKSGKTISISPPGKAAAKPGAIPPPAERKVGQAYDTPRGKMIWRGNGWEPAK